MWSTPFSFGHQNKYDSASHCYYQCKGRTILYSGNRETTVAVKALEKLLWLVGVLCLGIFGTHIFAEEARRSNDLATFKATFLAPASAAALPADRNATPEQSLWSEGRIAAFEESLTKQTSAVLGILEIPRLNLEVPVYDGASDLHMDRGAARIDGTAMPGEPGNLGVAGHRDGYFRVLKDIALGDEITITTADGLESYVVSELKIVDPTAVEVLDPTVEQAVTLVTCYPFYFVGHAPERFIVRAVKRSEHNQIT
jgi:sortase A